MIALEHVSRVYDGARVVDDVSLAIEAGAFCVLIGPSGSGKSTLLRMINCLVAPSAGTIRFGGEDVSRIAPEALRRRIGYAIQSVGLFPHWTVAANIATVPRLLRWPRERIEARLTALLHLLDLDPGLRGRYPHQLSGGQQQRVGVARALAADPEVLLMDEPFGALDPVTRGTLQQEMIRIHQSTGKTIVFVTHDMDEALRLGTQIAVLRQGRLVQVGTPRALLTEPADAFVRSFMGEGEAGLRLLSVLQVSDRARPGGVAPGDPVAPDLSLRDALSIMIARGTDRLPVADSTGRLGVLEIADLARPRG